MGLLGQKEKDALTKMFAGLAGPVRLVLFSQEFECQYCKVTTELVNDLAALSDKIKPEFHDLVKDAELAASYGVDKIPGLAVIGEKDTGIRFFGVPAGYEFLSLLEAIKMAGNNTSGLSKEVLEMLEKVDQPVRMQVMVSPTCPYCPKAVITAHRFAMASEHIKGEMVEVTEFPHVAIKYNVQGVPNTIINEKHSVIGAVPEIEMARAVLVAIGKLEKPAAAAQSSTQGDQAGAVPEKSNS
jgi:glutaredoxin-like protein